MTQLSKSGLGLAAAAVVLWFAVGSGAEANAEASRVRGEGWHRVQHEAWVDLGKYVDCVTWRYVVRENETLGEIAQRELGTASRHREILALNAGLKPKKLWAGARIVMPPRSTGCQGKGPKWVFFAWSPDVNGWAAPRQLVEGATHRVSHGARLYAVPAEKLHAVLSKATETGLDGRVLEREVGVARSGFVTLVDALPNDDPTSRIETHWRVGDVAEGRITLARIGEKRFDGAGLAVAAPTFSSSRPGTLLLVLSFALMLAVVGLAVARTQRLRESAAADEDLDDDEPIEDETEEPVEMTGADAYGELDDDEEYEEEGADGDEVEESVEMTDADDADEGDLDDEEEYADEEEEAYEDEEPEDKA